MRPMKIVPMITRRNESPSVEMYLSDVAKIPMIDANKEVQLSIAIQNGNEKAKNELVSANLRFVVSVAKQYQDQGLSLMDLINEGNLGLIKAAELFDHTRGFKFITYAVNWIRQSILQALAENSRVVRLPLNQISNINKVRAMLNEANQKNERETQPQELVSEELSLEEIDSLLCMNKKPIMLDSFVNDEDDVRIAYTMVDENSPSPDSVVMSESLSTDVKRMLSILTAKERKVIEMLFGIGQPEKNLFEIAEIMGVTSECVRQQRERALKKMHEHKNSFLSNYL